KTKGKQKIEMKEIENDVTKLTTFSKRRSGITKKASDLATLTGAVVVNYMPSVLHLLSQSLIVSFEWKQVISMIIHRQSRIDDLNQQVNQFMQKLEEEKKKKKVMKKKLQGMERNGWWGDEGRAPTKTR
ncbi:hypothetical protein Tsubulata_018040, partial [Turnera subulata]